MSANIDRYTIWITPPSVTLPPGLVLCDYCEARAAVYDIGEPDGDVWATCEACLVIVGGVTVAHSDEAITRE